MAGVKRYDAVVFSFPLGDTVYVDPVLVGHDTQHSCAVKAFGVQAATSRPSLWPPTSTWTRPASKRPNLLG